MKKKDKYLWWVTLFGLILAIFSPFVDSIVIDAIPSLENKNIFIEYACWCLSLLTIIGPWLYKMNKLIFATTGIIEGSGVITEKLNELSIWKKNEQLDKIKITISDLDDYLILLPLHLSVQILKGMDVKVQTLCCGSDKNAIEELKAGKSKFAITDPYYLRNQKNSDLILLAPIITMSPMWWMYRNKNDKHSDNKKKIRIFSYESDKKDTYTSRLLKKRIEDIGLTSGSYKIITIGNVVEELSQKLKEAVKRAEEERAHSLIENYEAEDGSKSLAGLKKDSKKITAFECLLFSCNENKSKATDLNSVSKICQEYFRQFDYYLVTEPDCSFIRKMFLYEADSVSLNNNESIFTGLITTRHYLQEFPVECLKMLRGLRDGIFRSNILLMNKDAATIKKAFHDALAAFSKPEKAQYFKQALEAIDTFMLDEKCYPDDLVIFDNSMGKYKDYNLNRYKDFLLRKVSSDNGMDSDYDNQNIKFIINGLGYDCK